MKTNKLFPLLLLMFLLSACSQNMDLRFPSAETWSLQTRFQYDKGLIDLAGGVVEAAVSQEMNVDIPLSNASGALDLLGSAFSLAKPQYAAKGITFNWQRPSEDTFVLDFSGKTLNQFNQIAPDMFIIQDLGGGKYRLQMTFQDLGDLVPGMGGMDAFGALFQSQVSLYAGRIISSNADRLSGGTATWENPKNIDVTFTPGGSISPACLLVAAGLVLAAAGIFAFTRLRGRPCVMCGARVSRSAGVCPKCGTPQEWSSGPESSSL